MTAQAPDLRRTQLPAIQARLDANGGVASTRELAEVGADRLVVSALVRSGALVRVRRDAIVDG